MIGIFLDTETNGLNVLKHQVLEIACCLVDMLTGQKLATFESLVCVSPEEWEASDPESLRVNGFKWEETLPGRPRKEVGKAIEALFQEHRILRGRAVFICQNPSFDRAFFAQLIDPDRQEALSWPYHWLDLASMYWAKALEPSCKTPLPWKTGLSKDAIANTLRLATEQKPHRAMNGVLHLMLCYEALVGFPQSSQTP